MIAEENNNYLIIKNQLKREVKSSIDILVSTEKMKNKPKIKKALQFRHNKETEANNTKNVRRKIIQETQIVNTIINSRL